MRIALYQPDIAGNLGTILRLAACMGADVDVVEPAGFAWSDRALARAGMDYAGAVSVRRHIDWHGFRATLDGRLVLATTAGAVPLYDAAFRDDDVLLFGSEGAGVPDDVHDAADLRVRVPMRDGFRSLNVAVACAMVVGEAVRQTGAWRA